MTDVLTDTAVQLTARLALAGMFAGAAWHKMRDIGAFAATLRNYRCLPAALVPAAAVSLAACEGAGAVALLAAPTAGAAMAMALLVLYSAAIGINLARGRRDIDCGCRGPAQRQPIGEWLLARNAALATAAGLLVLPERLRPLTLLDLFTIGAALAALALLWAAAHRLREQPQPMLGAARE